MDFINMKRGTGKTTKIIELSHSRGIPIVTLTIGQKQNILDCARRMGYSDVLVLTTNELSKLKEQRWCSYSHVLIDDAEQMIEKALEQFLGCKVDSLTISLPMK